MIGDETVEDDGLIFQTLGLVGGKDERRLKETAGHGLVFVAQDDDRALGRAPALLIQLPFHRVGIGQDGDRAVIICHRLHQEIALPVNGAEAAVFDLQQGVGDAGGLAAVAEIGAQHLHVLMGRQLRVAPEEGLDLGPGEKIGMDDLVGIAAEQKMPRSFQGLQDQAELDRGHVLHLVHHHEIVARLSPLQPLAGQEIQINEGSLR